MVTLHIVACILNYERVRLQRFHYMHVTGPAILYRAHLPVQFGLVHNGRNTDNPLHYCPMFLVPIIANI